MTKISLYIHIPFCVRKCLYCDFLSFYADNELKGKYVDALIKEIELRAPECFEDEVVSIFFGGGTPSTLDAVYISRILEAININYQLSSDCEISIEVNPGTYPDFNVYKKAGINRVSIGLQSANDEELKALGRIHTLSDFENIYKQVLLSGIENINVDLMSAIPKQSIESYTGTLKYVLSLKHKPRHISAYSLIVEENTPFYSMELQLPSEADERTMYKITDDILTQNGYHRYEISNYALDGFECRHNKVYWERGNYLGFGLGSSSMIDNIRWKNTSSMDEYLLGKMLKYEESSLSLEEQMEEFMFLGLRMTKGVSRDDFIKCFGKEYPKQYIDVIAKYSKEGYLKIAGDRVMLTDKGIDVSNVIFSEFIFD